MPSAVAAELYLLLLPVGHLVSVPVAGAWANAADLLLLPLLVVTVLELLAFPERGEALLSAVRGAAEDVPVRGFLLGLAMLVAFGGWVALSGRWGFHPRYAAFKGVGLAMLALGAGAVAVSGIGWKRAVDSWLGGAALALFLTLALGLSGPGMLRDRVIYSGGGILGLPLPRISGTLLHPNMMGDYLLVTGLLLWGRWPDLSVKGRRAAGALGVAVALGLVLTVSTAWIAGGVALILVGRHLAAEPESKKWSTLLRVAGTLVAAATLVAVLVPLDLGFAGMELRTSAIRPDIWRGALLAFLDGPLIGVGAAPYLAEAVDPFDPAAAVGLWDAHNAYLSVLGQFGLVGAALFGAGIWKIAGAAAATGPGRDAVALRIALIAVAVHAVFVASEDVRHIWLLFGLVGVAGARRA